MANPVNLKSLFSLWLLPVLSLSGWLSLMSQRASAQITPDATLGAESSRIRAVNQMRDSIEGGAIRGGNLFHSFEDFNIGEGREAYFANPAGIANILSRVTGSDVSDILGTLGVDGTANLFFLNPNGIIFGPNARLDISGSFVASTGDRLTFPDGSEFSAKNPEAPPLLTLNVPVGLQRGTAPRDGSVIASQGSLATGQDLMLFANEVDLQGQVIAGRNLTLLGTDTVRIRDSETIPFIAASQGELLVQGNETVDIFALNHPDSRFYSGSDLVLRSANAINGDAHFWSRGNFRIEQLDRNAGNLISLNDPIIRASGDVSFESYVGASLHILAGGSVTINGDIRITGADTTDNAINPINNPELANVTGRDGQAIIVNREPIIVDGEVQIIDGTVQYSEGEPLVIDGTEQLTLDIRAGTTAHGVNAIDGITNEIVGDPTNYDPTQNGSAAGEGTSADIIIQGTIINPGGLVFLTNQFEPNSELPTGDIEVGTIITQRVDRTFGNERLEVDGGNVVIDSRGSIDIEGTVISLAEARGGGSPFDSITGDADLEARGGDIILMAEDEIVTQALDASATVNLTAIDEFANDGLAAQTTARATGGRITLNAGSSILSGEINSSSTANISVSAVRSSFNLTTAFAGEIGRTDALAIGGEIVLDASTSLTSEDITSLAESNIGANASSGINVLSVAGTIDDVESNAFGGRLDFSAGDVLSVGSLDASIEANAIARTTAFGSFTMPNTAIGGEVGNLSAAGLGGSISLVTGSTLNSEEIDSSAFIGVNGTADVFGSTDTFGISGNVDDINVFARGGSIFLDAQDGLNTGNLNSIVGRVSAIDGKSEIISILVGGSVEVDSQDFEANALRGAVAGTLGETSGTAIGGDIDIRTTEGILTVSGDINSAANLIVQPVAIIDGLVEISQAGEIGEVNATTSSGNISLMGQSIVIGNLNSFTDVLVNAPMNSIGTNADITAIGIAGNVNIQSDGTLRAGTLSSFGEANIFGGARQSGSVMTDSIGGNIFLSAQNDLTIEDLNSSGDADIGVLADESTDITALASAGSTSLITAQGTISLEDRTIQGNVIFGDGNGGNVHIEAASINLENTTVTTDIVGEGNPGNITIETSGNLVLGGSTLTSSLGPEAEALEEEGGGIQIVAGVVTLNDFSLLNTTTFGVGNAGDIEINSRDSISLSDSSLFSLTAGQGNGGTVRLQSGSKINLLGNSVISTAVGFGARGRGGSVILEAPEQVLISGNNQIPDNNLQLGELGPLLIAEESNIRRFDFPLSFETPEEQSEKIQEFLENADMLQSLDNYFSIDDSGATNPNIEFSEEIPYVSVSSETTPGTVDVFSFTVESVGTQVVFDIDSPPNQSRESEFDTGFDTILSLFDENLNLLASNNDSSVTLGGSGSTSINDSYLAYIFNRPGRYFIRVSQSNDTINRETDFLGSNSYSLQVSRLNNFFINSGIAAQSRGNGRAGNININTPQLILENGSQIAVSADGAGRAGNITLAPFDEGENLNIRLDNSEITGTTLGNGRGGSLRLRAPNRIRIQGVGEEPGRIAVETFGAGDAGELGIRTGTLRIEDGVVVSARSNQGARGDAGDITVNATTRTTLSDSSEFSVETSSRGQAGDITINTPILTVASDAAITATATDTADPRSRGGSIFLNASTMDLSGRVGVFSETRGDAPAGNLILQPFRGDSTLDITLRNVAQVSASTRADGDGGNLSIAAPDSINIWGVGERPGRIAVETIGAGDAGTLTIETGNLRIQDGVIISALSGNRPSATGEAGDVHIDVNNLSLSERAEITVRNLNGPAGNINIDANRIFLNAGTISAETGRNAGSGQDSANVNLSGLELLLLQDGSLVSAEANRRADGGNITIDAEDGFVIGVSGENSDIIATAFRGNGGNIDISTLRIFGMQERSGTRDELRNNTTNDISASSQFGTDGAIAIEDLGIDPVQGVTELPIDTEAPPLSQGCQPGIDGQGRFVNTQQGGIPTNPSDPISSSGGWEDIQPANAEENELPDSQLPDEIVEAEGWQVNEQGQVVLRADMSTPSTVFDCQLQ
ncbi:MAG: filamentous hemagglutinin N-terminal domain-containing protein [Elainellaceae cyanobacterium]